MGRREAASVATRLTTYAVAHAVMATVSTVFAVMASIFLVDEWYSIVILMAMAVFHIAFARWRAIDIISRQRLVIQSIEAPNVVEGNQLRWGRRYRPVFIEL